MTSLTELKAWIDEQLPMLLDKYDVPGAAWVVLHGEELTDGAAGLLHRGTGVEATTDSIFQIGSVTKLWTASLVMQPHHEHVYFTATLDAAVWGAELAVGQGRERIYIVEPTGEFEDDPNVTDKKFPGNPTRSFRSCEPLRVVGELVGWVGHSPDKLQAMWDGLAELRRRGAARIED